MWRCYLLDDDPSIQMCENVTIKTHLTNMFEDLTNGWKSYNWNQSDQHVKILPVKKPHEDLANKKKHIYENFAQETYEEMFPTQASLPSQGCLQTQAIRRWVQTQFHMITSIIDIKPAKNNNRSNTVQ